MNYREFIIEAMEENYKTYGAAGGDIKLINEYFKLMGWDALTVQQFKAIASILRGRNEHLTKDEYKYQDMRIKALPNNKQLNFLDALYSEDAEPMKKAFRYFERDDTRLNLSDSRVKKSIRGKISVEHINATKMLFPLLIQKPTVKLHK